MKDRKLDIKPSDYTLALKIKNGHRYFWLKEQRLPPERGGYGDVLAIADDSGEYPHLTDDGLLYVDWASDIVAGGDNRQASVPLIDLEGLQRGAAAGSGHHHTRPPQRQGNRRLRRQPLLGQRKTLVHD